MTYLIFDVHGLMTSANSNNDMRRTPKLKFVDKYEDFLVLRKNSTSRVVELLGQNNYFNNLDLHNRIFELRCSSVC